MIGEPYLLFFIFTWPISIGIMWIVLSIREYIKNGTQKALTFIILFPFACYATTLLSLELVILMPTTKDHFKVETLFDFIIVYAAAPLAAISIIKIIQNYSYGIFRPFIQIFKSDRRK